MRYPWTTVAILIIWLSASILMTTGALPNPEIFFVSIMVVTIVLAYIGFRSL